MLVFLFQSGCVFIFFYNLVCNSRLVLVLFVLLAFVLQFFLAGSHFFLKSGLEIDFVIVDFLWLSSHESTFHKTDFILCILFFLYSSGSLQMLQGLEHRDFIVLLL